MKLKNLIIICLVVLNIKISAITESTRIMATSSTGRSIKIGLGSLDGVSVGEMAKFFVPDFHGHDHKVDPNLKNKNKVLAIGEAIKVNRSTSYWHVKRIGGAISYRGNIKEDLPLLVMRMGIDKRRPFVTRQTLKIEGRAKDQEIYKVDEGNGVPKDLIFEEDNYEQGEKLGSVAPTKSQDIETTVKKIWTKGRDEYDEDFSDVFAENIAPSLGDLSLSRKAVKKIEYETWDETTKGVAKKYNKLKYGLNSLYRGVVHDEGSNMRSTVDQMEYKTRRQKEKLDKVAVRTAIERMKKKPYTWSEDLTDRELRQFVVDAGVVEEIKRQKIALRESLDHDVSIRYSTPLQSSSLLTDEDNQGLGYGVSLSYEFALGRISEDLKKLTFEVELESALAYHNIGMENGRFEERSAKIYLNWYLLRPPSMISHFMPYVSLGLERGSANMDQQSLDRSYSYDMTSLLSAKFGLKYRFKAGDGRRDNLKIGYGYNLLMSYDSTKYLLKLEDNSINNSDLYSSFQSSQMKLSLGFNIYF